MAVTTDQPTTPTTPTSAGHRRLDRFKWPIGYVVVIVFLFLLPDHPPEPGQERSGPGIGVAAGSHDQRVPDVGDHGSWPQCRGGLCRPARPRLRRVLGLGWLHRGLADGVPVQLDVQLPSVLTGAGKAPGTHINFWLVIIIAGILCAILGLIIGAPTLRLRGDYLALVTLGFGEVITQFFRNSNDIAGLNLANGDPGISSIDPIGTGPLGAAGIAPKLLTNSAAGNIWKILVLGALVGVASLSRCGSGKADWGGPGWPFGRTSWRPA